MKTTIIYYTHNFISRKILESTLKDAIRHAEENDCFLLIISHFPVLKDYVNVKEQFGGTDDLNLPPDLDKFSIRDQHGLNTTASLSIMRTVYDNGDLEKEYKELMSDHPYWGNSKRFINMLEAIEESQLSHKAHAVGIHRCKL